ncbi:MAG: hypothetical protein ACFB2W_15030 [Leptolyngbyaceae cyanobacterium]
MKKLVAQLEYPAVQSTPPPQSGFRAPLTVWLVFAVSLLTSVLSLFAFWSIYFPYHLFPLPYRILKRNFVFFEVQGALLLLPLMTILSLLFVDELIMENSTTYNFIFGAAILSFFVAPLMLLLIRLPGMKRWGKPMASAPIFAQSYRPSADVGVEPMRVMLDFAVEDRRYARAITRQLKRYGHHIEKDESSAEIIIVLISSFKKTTTYSPEKHIIFPVLLQSIEDIDSKLSPIQWVDFRRGLRNLRYFCMLLPNPTKMLSALGIVPMGRQVVLPPVIQILSYFLVLSIGLMVGGTGLSVIALGVLLESSTEVVTVVSMIVTMLASVFLTMSARKALLSRQGQLATFRNFALSLVGLVSLWIVQFLIVAVATPIGWEEELLIDLSFADKLNHAAGLIQSVLAAIVLMGLTVCFILSLWHWKDLYRWMPRKVKRSRVDDIC